MGVIHIFGASGSGVTTLGALIARQYDCFHMDTDDYFWLPTDPRFQKKRAQEERISLIRSDFAAHQNAVLSGSLTGWGDELIPMFDLAIRVCTDRQVRLERIRQREASRFGTRILPGGDMHEQHIAFLKWAGDYDTGGLEMRSAACHDAWEKRLTCPVVRVSGEKTAEKQLEALNGPILRAVRGQQA